jgi:hypothetical protein
MALAITHIGNAESGTDGTVFDYGNFNAPEAGLMVVVLSGYNTTAPTISSVSIGGTNGTVHVQASGHQRVTLGIATREVSSGNQNVTVTFGSTSVISRVSVYLLTGYDSATPTDTDFQYLDGVTSRTATLDFPADGIAVYGFQHQSNTTTSWGAASEDYDVNTENVNFSSAHKTASGAGNTETATASATNARTSIIGAVWAPAAAGGTILPMVNSLMLAG